MCFFVSKLCLFILLIYFVDFGLSVSGVANVTVYWDGGGPLCNCTSSSGEFTPTFACNYGDRGNWSDGVKPFLDPTPPDATITNITAILYGTIACDVFSPGPTVFLKIGQTVFASSALSPNLPCFCANCVQSETVLSNFDSSCGLPGFVHGAVNPFQIIVEENSLCLSRIELYFNYTVAAPFYGVLSPTLGPADGSTQVTVQGYVPPKGEESDIVCVFNSTTAPATVTGADTVQCESPSSGGYAGSVPFYVTTNSACPGMLPALNTTIFEYYPAPNISSVLPTRGPTKGGTAITIMGSLFINTSELMCKVGVKLTNATFISDSQILCLAPPGSGSSLVQISFNGQNYHSANVSFVYQAPKTFWTDSTTSWIILSISGVAALGLILLFIGLIKSKFKKDGYHQIVEGKHITIDEVRLGPRIGKGNFGEVYKAYWRGAEIAVKKLPAHNMTDQFLKDFHKEVSLMRALRHPNVIQFLGSCTVLPDICICTEYMPRGSLYKILHDPSQSLNWALIKKMCVDAAKGCVYLHDCSPVIVHRDLKSHNILLDDKWNARIADFGIARIKDISNSKKGKGDQAIGTVFWTAPEIFLGQSNTEKSDCYSFGIVLWELVHRENPYNEKDVMTVAYEVSRKGLRLPITASVPPRYKELIENCWDASPERRPSFHHVAQTLRQLAHAHPLTHFRAHAHSLAHSCDSASVVFVRTRVRASCTLWDSVPGGMLHSMTMHNQLLRSLLGSYEGYEVAFENDKGEGEKEREGFLFAFEGVGSALNFCLNVQIALLQVTWPPSILSFPAASVVFKSVGRKLWSGLRVRMSIHSGTCSSSFDHVSGRTKYFGSAVDKTHHILRAAPKWASIIVSETIMQKINTNNIKSTEDIKCDACGIMVDSNKKQEHLYSVLPLSLSSRSNFYTELSVVGPNGETDEEVISPFEEPEEDHLPWTIPFSSIVLKENIGRGPIGDYFRATWKNKEVAVKELINQKLQESDILYLKSKISNLCKLKHKNVVEVFGVCFEVGHISVVTEYIPGNLRQVLNNDFVPLTWKTKLRIAHQIAEGMSYLVEHPDPDIYIHENLKSGNIHVNVDRGVVKISDHGQGVLRDLARTMTSVDNIAWTAPEILRGESATAAISIYSFGIILFEIATRREPYTDEHPVMLVEKVLEGFRPSGAPQCPPGYQELMEECWDSNPDNRPTWSYCAHTLGGILAQNKN